MQMQCREMRLKNTKKTGQDNVEINQECERNITNAKCHATTFENKKSALNCLENQSRLRNPDYFGKLDVALVVRVRLTAMVSRHQLGLLTKNQNFDLCPSDVQRLFLGATHVGGEEDALLAVDEVAEGREALPQLHLA